MIYCLKFTSDLRYGWSTFRITPSSQKVIIKIHKIFTERIPTHNTINPLNAELNPICHLLGLLGVHHFLHISRIRVKSLTLRLLMHLFLMFLDHTRHTTVSRTPLDEWSARHRDLYLTTHDTHNRQISMPPVGFEPMISAGEWPAEIVGSNPTGGMDICLLWVSCVVR